ncbi:MAG: SDR family NAD(P)-dependent oxidoreductase [Ktedonobacterales bacterium]
MSRSAADFRAKYGPWAVVAGASQGLGEEYARQLAARGLHLILVARRTNLTTALAEEFTAAYGTLTRVITLDLARADAAEVVDRETADLEIGLLVYNAALSVIGSFFDGSLDDHVREIRTNCQAPMTLTHTLGRKMAARGRGGIVLMSSLSATMGSALIANYAATKAYNLVLAEGLWEEMRTHGVDVMACCAPAVTTPNYLASAPARTSPGTMTPEGVVREALKALGKTPSYIPGRTNRISAFALRRLLPRKLAIQTMGNVMRGMYAKTK